LLKKMSPEQRDKFMAEEDAAKQHDAAKSRHVLKTTGMFKAAGSPLAAGGRGGRGGRGVRGSGTLSRPAAPPAATPFVTPLTSPKRWPRRPCWTPRLRQCPWCLTRRSTRRRQRLRCRCLLWQCLRHRQRMRRCLEKSPRCEFVNTNL
jgi:hypothetical protein